MAWSPVESSWAKYHRACGHLDEFGRAVGDLTDPKTKAVVTETQFEGTEGYVRVTRVPDFRDCGLMLGDAINNFRSALDHLAWDLVKLGGHARLTAEEALYVQYPLAKSPGSLRYQRTRGRLIGVGPDEWRLVGRYQPYRRNQVGRSLRFLRDISDLDKHRYITPNVVCMDEFRFRYTLVNCTLREPPRAFTSRRRALKVGTKLAHVSVTPILVGASASDFDIGIDSELAIYPALRYGVALEPLLTGIRGTVFEILTAFDELI